MRQANRVWDMSPWFSTTWPGWLAEAIMLYVVWAPFNLTSHRSKPWRALGLLGALVWMLPAFVVMAIPLLLCIIADMASSFMSGDR